MSSGFVSETDIEKQKRIRQQEWEKVRKPDDPIEAPEEEYDPRTLYDRLEEQRKKKEFEYEETHRLKNMIKGLDDDEADFLELVDRTKMAAEKKLLTDEANELKKFRSKVASLEEEKMDKLLAEEVKPVTSTAADVSSSSAKPTQKTLLAGAVKKRSSIGEAEGQPPCKMAKTVTGVKTDDDWVDESPCPTTCGTRIEYPSARQCVGILPGIGYYNTDSSDSCSEKSSDLEDDSVYDLFGRKVVGRNMK